MISKYELTLDSADCNGLLPCDAYRFYSRLLSNLTEEQGDMLHMQSIHPVSQYISFNKKTNQIIWRVSLLNDTAHELFADILEQTEEITLHDRNIHVIARTHSEIKSPGGLISESRNTDSDKNRVVLHFLAPTAFKQNGQYTFIPQERLIVQSLMRSWSRFCPEYALDDPDALQMLSNGIRITEYSIHSVRFPLKNASLSGFMGKVTVSPKLALPMMELWKLLLIWAEYSGIGIKTSLGMGGVAIEKRDYKI